MIIKNLALIEKLRIIAFSLLSLVAFFYFAPNLQKVSAQACTGSFFCCEISDAYGSCIGTAGPFSCQGTTSFQCSSFPTTYCSANYSAPVLYNGCSGGTPPPPGPPPPGPPPPPGTTPPPDPIPVPVTGNARPRYTFGQPYPFPCDEVAPDASAFGDLEFHSLRPYQASPCNQEYEDLALFCGNDLVLVDPVNVIKTFSSDFSSWDYALDGVPITPAPYESPPGTLQPCETCVNDQCVRTTPGSCVPEAICSPLYNDCNGNCTDNGDGTETCTFEFDRVRDIAIDLQGAYLPIMGFTEPSVGSTGRPDRVINSILQDETMQDPRKVNEYVSWYLNGVIGRAEYPPPNPNTQVGKSKIIDFSGPLKKLFSFDSQENIRRDEIGDAGNVRHDQVVVCTNLLGIPTPCYPNRPGVTRRRMTNVPRRLLEYVPFSSTEDRLGKVYFGSYYIQPPLSSAFRILSSAITNQSPAVLFFAHMQESFELADILQRSYAYQGADLDAEAEDYVTSFSPLCDLRAVRSNPGDNLFPGELSATVEYEAQVDCTYCIEDEDIPGNLCRCLSGGAADCVADTGQVCGTNYGQVDCEAGFVCAAGCSGLPTGTPCESVPPLGTSDPFDGPFACFPSAWGCTSIGSGNTSSICPSGYDCADVDSCNAPQDQINLAQDCSNNVYISFRTVTAAPLAEEVWTKLVAGPTSVFRRIFPQIEDEEGRPITRLWDLPAATSVIYQSLTPGVTVIAGNPASGRGDQGELYFRHIGGLHEYFLKCIQKTLRPEGFGEGCISGPEPLAGIGDGTCATPPPAGTSFGRVAGCSLGTGLCSPSNLEPYFRAAGCSNPSRKARQASMICNGESGGNPSAINCSCLTGGTDYSIGLFQINLLAHCAHQAFDWDWGRACVILDQDRVDYCANLYFDPDENIEYMIQLSNCGTRWTPWSVYTQSCRSQIDGL